MPNEYFDFGKSQFLNESGVDLEFDNRRQIKVAVPSNAVADMSTDFVEYKELISKKRHAGVKDKASGVLKSGKKKLKNLFSKNAAATGDSLSPTESIRRSKLAFAFKERAQAIIDGSNYFSNCLGVEFFGKYISTIKKDYKALLNKGYIKEDVLRFSKNSAESELPGKYGMRQAGEWNGRQYSNLGYATNCQGVYATLYESFTSKLNQIETAYSERKKAAIDVSNDCMDVFERYVTKINELKAMFDRLNMIFQKSVSEKISGLTPKDAKSTKENIESINQQSPKIEAKLKAIIKKSKGISFEAIFSSDRPIAVPKSLITRLQSIADGLDAFAQALEEGKDTEELKNKCKYVATMLGDRKTQQYVEAFLGAPQPAPRQGNLRKIADDRTLLLEKWEKDLEQNIEKIDSALEEMQEKMRQVEKLYKQYLAYREEQSSRNKRQAFMWLLAVMFALMGQFGGVINAINAPEAPKVDPLK